MVFSLFQTVLEKYIEHFMVKTTTQNFSQREGLIGAQNFDTMTPSHFLKKASKREILGIKESKAQLIIKLLTDYLNKMETFQHFLVISN